MAFNWKTLIPFYGAYEMVKNAQENFKDGYQFGDILKSEIGIVNDPKDVVQTEDRPLSIPTDGYTDSAREVMDQQLQENGSVVSDPTNPVASAANVISYDPNKSAQDNLLDYAKVNNSASAYSTFLNNQHISEMENSAIRRAVADAEAAGISKYQLFQSGNAQAASPSSAGSFYQSYENAMNRRVGLSETELKAYAQIIASVISSAGQLLKKI